MLRNVNVNQPYNYWGFFGYKLKQYINSPMEVTKEGLTNRSALIDDFVCIFTVEYPNYISNTFTFDQHSRVLPNPATKISLKSQPAWKFTMSAEEREIAKKSLRELNRKTNYLHNPRHSAHAHINTASYGPTKNNTRDKSKKIKSIFIAEPSQVTFTDYIAGETYKVHFK
jgi:hypothetical protein